MELILNFCVDYNIEGVCQIPSSSNSNISFEGSAFECAKKITQTASYIKYDYVSDLPDIIDLLKKKESEKKCSRSKKKRNKKAGKTTPDILENLENKENDNMCNGHHSAAITGQKMSDNMEKDVISMLEMVEKLKGKPDDGTTTKVKNTETSIGNMRTRKPTQCVLWLFLRGGERLSPSNKMVPI